MPLVSLQYLVFLLLVVGVYYGLPLKQKAVLLVASLIFVALASPASLAALVVLSLLNQQMARAIGRAATAEGRRKLFWIGIGVNVLVILVCKYFENTPLGFYFDLSLINFRVNHLVFILGLSFYSLQNIAYLADTWLGRRNSAGTMADLLLYNGFFPKIIAGPILLPGEFFPVSHQRVSLDRVNLSEGAQRILLGMFKKLVIADRLSLSVHSVFDYRDAHPGITSLVAAYLFTIQLYFDFSGYSDMAIGAAQLFGIRIKENFRFPLYARSVSEFWRRWHISLIDWLSAYLYYPIVYRWRRYKRWAAAAGIVVTFIISGIWHGIGWTFFCWSICHMIYLLGELSTKNLRLKLNKRLDSVLWQVMTIFLTFNLVSLSNIFFRATRFSDALRMFRQIFSGWFMPHHLLGDFIAPLASGGNLEDLFNIGLTLGLTGALLVADRLMYRQIRGRKLNLVFILAGILLILYFGVLGQTEKFIYTQF